MNKNLGDNMAPGIYGADIEQLRSLSKSMGLSGSRLLDTERQISSLVSVTGWKGNDAGQFRREWSGTLRPMLNKASQSLIDAAKMLLTQANEQQQASTSSVSGGPCPGGAANTGAPAAAGSPQPTGFEGVLSVAGSPEWWAANAAVTGAGLYTDNLLATMAKGGPPHETDQLALADRAIRSDSRGWLHPANSGSQRRFHAGTPFRRPGCGHRGVSIRNQGWPPQATPG